MPANTKIKGDQAELAVAADLASHGYRLLFPYGENCPYDLMIDFGDRVCRIQVKYHSSDENTWIIKPYTMNGYTCHKYTDKDIDYIAGFDPRTKTIVYVPAVELGEGVNTITLRWTPTKNGQSKGIRFVSDYLLPPR